MKIVVTDARTVTDGNPGLGFLSQFGDVELYELTSPEETSERVRGADIILCNKTKLGRENLASADKLKYIGVFATGYNNIDTAYTSERKITVCNAGSYSSGAVAQQTMAYILEFFTKTAEYNRFSHDGGWKESRFFSPFVFDAHEIEGKTLGIIGYGSIGHEVAKRAAAFGMKILAYTRTQRPDPSGIAEFAGFEEVLSRSDVVTVHCPLTEKTRYLFDSDTFRKMKDGAYFINTSRGGILSEAALLSALESGKLSGAAIDVLEEEPMRGDCVLFSAPNLIITPHIAWTPFETRVRLLKIVENNIRAFLSGSPVNVVV